MDCNSRMEYVSCIALFVPLGGMEILDTDTVWWVE